jgi:UrcA family protein
MTYPFRDAAPVRILGASLMAIAALAAGGSALAQSRDPEGARSVAVRYADLDLHSAAGAHEMLARIGYAASQVCGGEPDVRVLSARNAFSHCRSETITHAVHRLHASLVASMAGEREAAVIVAGK